MGFDSYSRRQFVFSSVIIISFLIFASLIMFRFSRLPLSHNSLLTVSWTFSEKGKTPDLEKLWKEGGEIQGKNPHHNYKFGFTQKDVWMRLSLQPSHSETFIFIDVHNIVDEIEVLYSPGGSSYFFGRQHPEIAGQPGSLMRNHSVIPVRVGLNTTYVIMRFSNLTHPLHVPLRVYNYSEKEFNNNKLLLLSGILIGFLVLTLLVNGLFHFIITDKTYIIYTLFLFFCLIYLLSEYGLLYSFFHVSSEWWNARENSFYILLSTVFSIIFINNFLGVYSKNPAFSNSVLFGCLGAAGLFVVLLVTGAALSITVLVIHILFLLVLPIGLLFYILLFIDRGNTAHVFFFSSWLSVVFGITTSTLMNLAVIPWNVPLRSVLWGFFVIHVFLMFMALADRVRAAQKHKEMAEKKLSNERNRIAAEIHDSVGADFAVFVQELMVWPDKRYPAREIIPKLKFYLIRIRDIVYMLNRDYDIHTRLEKEMKERIQRLDRLKKFELSFEMEKCGEILGLEKSYHMLCVFDEWLTNILKYSKASKINIRLFKGNNRIRLRIEHDGKGIEWKPGYNPDGIAEGQGLKSITWRARSIGAEAVSSKGDMNTFTLSIPVQFVTGIL